MCTQLEIAHVFARLLARSQHAPASCKQLSDWNAKFESDHETQQYMKLYVKQCPNCGRMVKKEGGCNHIWNCPCKFHWCWVCQKPWEGHGDYYNCTQVRQHTLTRTRAAWAETCGNGVCRTSVQRTGSATPTRRSFTWSAGASIQRSTADTTRNDSPFLYSCDLRLPYGIMACGCVRDSRNVVGDTQIRRLCNVAEV